MAVQWDDDADERPPAGYHSTDALQQRLVDLAAASGGRARLEQVGTTVQGRPIPALWIAAPGRTPGGSEAIQAGDAPAPPVAMVIAGIHGCEVIATELALELVERLASPPPSAAAKAVLDRGDVVVMPTVNVDGRSASLSSLGRRRWWNPAPRRNAHGVDLNRHWPFPDGVRDSWLPISGVGVDWLPWYRGTEPLSEPENRAVAGTAERTRPAVLLNLHSTGSILTSPWGCKPEAPAPAAVAAWRAMIAAFNAAQPRWRYRSKQSRAWYPILGNSNDWFHDRFGTLSMTVETSPPAAEVKRSPRLGRWAFWYANPVDRDAWVANDVGGCLAALDEGLDRGPIRGGTPSRSS